MNKALEPQKASGKNKVAVSLSLGVSIFFHLLILILVGSVVLIQGVIPKTIFHSEIVAEPTTESPHMEEEPTPEANPEEMAEPEAGSPQKADSSQEPLSSTEVIQTLSNSPTPVLPAAGNSGLSSLGTSFGTAAKGSGKSPHLMTSVFGFKGGGSDALTGHFYDLKQTAAKQPSDMALNPREIKEGFTTAWREYPETKKYDEVVRRFTRNWDESVLATYFHAPDTLSTYQIFFPKMKADAAPKAFDVGQDVQPLRWLVHYKGEVTSPLTGEIRFVGFGDDVLMVRFNKRNVLDACFRPMAPDFNDKEQGKVGMEYNSGRPLMAGTWIKVTKGESYPMEVLIGECPGGDFRCFLLVQEKGKTYLPRSGTEAPRLPVFQTAATPLPNYQLDKNGPSVDSNALIFQKAE